MTQSTPRAALLADIRSLIEEARAAVAATVNAGLTLLYWRIGQRVNAEVLQGERAEYGRETIFILGRQLETEFGRGFSEKSLRHMVRFAEAFPDIQIVASSPRSSIHSFFAGGNRGAVGLTQAVEASVRAIR